MILLYLMFSFDSHPCGMQNGAVEAYWAHNPEVRGSKPRSAIFVFSLKVRKRNTSTRTRT